MAATATTKRKNIVVAVVRLLPLCSLPNAHFLLMMQNAFKLLEDHLPTGCAEGIRLFMVEQDVRLKITSPRKSKLGDFRPATRRLPHRISINGTLNRYAFAVTLVHELAHLVVWKTHGKRHLPHGSEWKSAFNELSNQLIFDNLPGDLQHALAFYFSKNAGSRRASQLLTRSLQRHNTVSNLIELEKLPDGILFEFNQMIFRKIHRIRTRYRCVCLSTNRQYAFSPLALVYPENKTG